MCIIERAYEADCIAVLGGQRNARRPRRFARPFLGPFGRVDKIVVLVNRQNPHGHLSSQDGGP